MRRSLWLVGLLAVALGLTLAVVWPRGGNKMERASEEQQGMDPLLQALLEEPVKNDRDQQSRFFTTLIALGRKHGKSPLDEARARFVDEGYAVRVGTGRDRHVVAILCGNDPFLPGRDTQYLLLLDAEGGLLDTLACSISNRLTRMFVDHSGTFRTDVPQGRGEDGAQLVIRYIPEDGGSVSGNWSHDITCGGRTYTFGWNQTRPGVIRSTEWEARGLCRVAIREGRFVVVFPRLEEQAVGREQR